jgi:hypothetical protein
VGGLWAWLCVIGCGGLPDLLLSLLDLLLYEKELVEQTLRDVTVRERQEQHSRQHNLLYPSVKQPTDQPTKLELEPGLTYS